MQFRYISDLHIYDAESIDWRPEHFSLDTYVMSLLDCWNAFTDEDDYVIIVGDIGHKCPRTIEVLKRLKGIKILVIGNHDLSWGRDLWTCGVFSGIHESIENNGIYVQHIPQPYSGNCQYYVHGHHHRYDAPGMQNALLAYARDTYRLNCAADLNGNRPCTLQELELNKAVLMDKYREQGLLQEVY